MFAVKSIFPSPAPFLPIFFSLSFSLTFVPRVLRAYIRGRGIIFAVLPIQLCVRRKAAFNKSLIKGKQRAGSSVVLSLFRAVSSCFFRFCARETPSVFSLPFSLSFFLLRISFSSSKGLSGKTDLSVRRRKEGIRGKERDSRKEIRSCHAPTGPTKK